MAMKRLRTAVMAALVGFVGVLSFGLATPGLSLAGHAAASRAPAAPAAPAPPEVHTLAAGHPLPPPAPPSRPALTAAGGSGRRYHGSAVVGRAPANPALFASRESPAALMARLGPLPAGWEASSRVVSADGMERDYLLLRPAALAGSSRVPVVVLLAGQLMTPDGVLHASGLAAALAATGPAVLVVPAGWHESWDAGDCCSAAYAAHVDDVSFIKTVVSSVLASTPATSASDVYAVGFSNGGRLAYRLGCAMPGAWRGFVAVEAVPVEGCSAMTPLAVTVIAQQADPLLTVSAGPPKHVQGFVEPTVSQTVSRMVALDRCPARAAAPTGQVPTGQALQVGRSVVRTWSCAGGAVVRYVWYPGGAHEWRPSVAGTPGATDYVLQMLGRGPLSGLPLHRGT
jgi:polyhydroxybutyrate depolymerase